MQITQQEIETAAERFPGSPMPKDEAAREQWLRWRIILDRVISSRHYRHDDPKKGPYLKLASFASQQMGAACTLTYRPARPLWEREFGPRHAPDPAITMLLREKGIRDDSYHNDTHPHLSKALSRNRRIELWWAPANKARREGPGCARYYVSMFFNSEAADEREESLYTGEDTDLALAVFRSNAFEPEAFEVTLSMTDDGPDFMEWIASHGITCEKIGNCPHGWDTRFRSLTREALEAMVNEWWHSGDPATDAEYLAEIEISPKAA